MGKDINKLESIKNNINSLKEAFEEKHKKHRDIDKIVLSFASQVLSTNNPEKNIKNFQIKSTTLYLNTNRKIIAQELNLYKEQFIKKMPEYITKVVIR